MAPECDGSKAAFTSLRCLDVPSYLLLSQTSRVDDWGSGS
jgi:hypothetical protein